MNNSQRFWRGLFFILMIIALCAGLALPIAEGTPARAAPKSANLLDVIINEIAWAGTQQTDFDEWIELYNTTNQPIDLTNWRIEAEDGSPSISLTGSIAPNAYLLLERGSQNVTDQPGMVYNSNLLTDTGEILYILDNTSSIIDTVNPSGGMWPAGSNSGNKPSMERIEASAGSEWGTFNDTSTFARDAGSNDIYGTPGRENWSFSTTVVTITSDSPDPSIVDQDVNVTVTVVGVSPAPTGLVEITGAENNCTINLSTISNNTSSGSCAVRFTSTGSRTITANYLGDGTHPPNSDTEPHEVTSLITTTTITADTPDPSSVGASVTVSVSVTSTSGSPTGRVEITYANEIRCTITLNSSGTGSCSFVFKTAGSKTITANYLGDGTQPPSSDTESHQVTNTSTTTITADTSDPSALNEKVTVTVNVSGGIKSKTPTGTVAITGADTNCTITLDSSGTGSCSVRFSGTGARTITATYSGDSNHPASSDTEPHTVVEFPSKTAITSHNPNPSATNAYVTVQVKVSHSSGSARLTGRVQVTASNTNSSCNINLNSSGTGSCLLRLTTSGNQTITATYLGDSNYAASRDRVRHNVTLVLTPTKIITRTPTPAPPPPLVAINEFVPRPGHDWNLDGVVNTGDEYIELLNHGVIDVNLSGYRLDDEVNIGSSPYTLPSVTLKPGERIVLYGSETGLLLSDGGDGVRLLKSNGQLVDAYNYYVVRFPDQSYCRLPDNGGLDDWNQNCFPTPGLQNSLGSVVNPPEVGGREPSCPIADTLPDDFVFAECLPFGHNIWNSAYWDRFGWFDEQSLPNSPGKWPLFAD